MLFEIFISGFFQGDERNSEMPEKFWSMKKITTNIQYRTEYKTVTLGGIPTLSKEEYLLPLICAAFFLIYLYIMGMKDNISDVSDKLFEIL